MKVLFFLLDGATNASSYHRVLQYFPLLRANAIQPYASRPVPEPLYQRLVERGSGDFTTPRKLAFYSLFMASRLSHVLQAGRFDVAVIQRDLFPFGPPLLERLLVGRNVRLVFDTDDATYLRPAFTPNTPFQKLRRFDKVSDVVRHAYWVSAATEPIAAWARGYNANVSVVPMALDLATYDRVPRRRDQTLTLGWAGTAGGLRYLDTLAPILRELAAHHDIKLRVISGGHRQVCLPGMPVEARQWLPETGLQQMAQFDIGLLPLDDTPFERAKFPFKLLQYMALNVPVVSAHVGMAASVIRHGENGLLARSPDEWLEALTRLITDAELRRRVAKAGHTTVATSYTVERVGPLLIQGLRDAAA